jgi:hypothetical protein
MNNFEDQLDVIRLKLYEETKEMDKEDIINNVNSHAQRIAQEFGIKIDGTVSDSALAKEVLLRV